MRCILKTQINYFISEITCAVKIQRTFLVFPDRVSRKIFKEEELDVKNVIRLLYTSQDRFRQALTVCVQPI